MEKFLRVLVFGGAALTTAGVLSSTGMGCGGGTPGPDAGGATDSGSSCTCIAQTDPWCTSGTCTYCAPKGQNPDAGVCCWLTPSDPCCCGKASGC